MRDDRKERLTVQLSEISEVSGPSGQPRLLARGAT